MGRSWASVACSAASAPEGARPDAEAVGEGKRAPDVRAPAAQPGPAEVPPDHIAAIAAAVAALGSGLKVVHIADAATGRDWVTEGRWAHQMSHQKTRRPR